MDDRRTYLHLLLFNQDEAETLPLSFTFHEPFSLVSVVIFETALGYLIYRPAVALLAEPNVNNVYVPDGVAGIPSIAGLARAGSVIGQSPSIYQIFGITVLTYSPVRPIIIPVVY